jgi:hypothetical protein
MQGRSLVNDVPLTPTGYSEDQEDEVRNRLSGLGYIG